jgi:tRNA (cytosine38-C5)-methyltransferase
MNMNMNMNFNKNKKINMKVFEFFSGVGGMHQALKDLIEIKEIYPFDINPNANLTYLHNFNIKPNELSLESFSLLDYDKLCSYSNKNENEIIWVMSPPCQPFTRQGKQLDLNDERTKGFKQLVNILNKTKNLPEYLLLENVKNFEVNK